MKFLLPALALAGLSSAGPVSTLETRQSGVGTGPYAPAGYYTSNSLGGHTFYAPQNVPSGVKLPVLVWGNGACAADGTAQAPFLTQLASHGILVIASGSPHGGGSTTADIMKQSIDFISSNAGKGQWANVDASRIAAAGWSCGGTEAYQMINDARVSHIGIWSSGLLSNYDQARSFRKPVFFFLGGPSDIAYQNGERDYSYMPAGVPKWKGNLNVGHGGTYTDYNGGKFGVIGGHWVQWMLRGNTSASDYMTGNAAKSDGWSVVSQYLENLSVTPINDSTNPGGGGGGSSSVPPTTTTTTSAASSGPTGGNGGGNSGGNTGGNSGGACSGMRGQCGGQGWNGPTCCSQGTCQVSNPWYSQCL